MSKQSNDLIENFLKENELRPMHLELYLDEVCDMVCRSKEEDDEIGEELEKLRSEQY